MGEWGSCGRSGPIRRVSTEASLEERLAALETNLDQLRGETEAKIQGVQQELVRVRKSVPQQAQERQNEDQKMARKIEEVAVGGLHLEMVGLAWLIIGLIGTSIPDEITVWLFK